MAGALRRAVPSALASRLLVSSVYVTNTSGVHVRALSLSHGALSGLLLGRSGTDSSSTVFGVNTRGFASSSSSDTHDDFKPQANEGTTASVLETIENDLKANKVFVYMKVGVAKRQALSLFCLYAFVFWSYLQCFCRRAGNPLRREELTPTHRILPYAMQGYPDFPQCGFSGNVCRVLDAYEVKYGSRNVLEDPELREGIKEYTKWPTIPQIFVDGEFVGGHDVLMQMHHDGTLEEEFHGGGKSTT